MLRCRAIGNWSGSALSWPSRASTSTSALGMAGVLRRVRRSFSFGVEHPELLGDEPPVDPDRGAVEGDRPATILGALDLDQVPVDLRAVAVVGLVVGVARGQVE